MGIKRIQIMALVFLGLCNMQLQCARRLGCAENMYSFALDIRAYPDHESIKIGDTLWLEISESTTLLDAQSGEMIDYRNAANLGSAVSFSQFSSENRFNLEAVNKFEFHLVEGVESRSINEKLFKNFLFAEKNGTYRFKLALIPKETGVFMFAFERAANVYRRSDRCTKAAFSINFKETNQHYYLHPHYVPGTSYIGGDYYFRVVD